MRTFQKVKGTPVFLLENGSTVGKINDLFVDDDGCVIGFWVAGRKWWRKRKFLRMDAIVKTDPSAIFIKDANDLSVLPDSLFRFHVGRNHLFGKPLLTEDGAVTGLLEDVYFLDDLGTIVGYEVTNGFYSDFTEGKHVVKSTMPLQVEKNRLVLRTHS
ncbi:PRC-barrel domain-containing protein [Alteribacter aurantiacus]|uniref:PRC-barrel domain-containing protein n=1 Tax=Alteribacter aurantiacus TaxID=254410 RepID=UPI00040C41C6|nr:PRC-barrel domain-containing protein [Alteribacter aurantiacus]